MEMDVNGKRPQKNTNLPFSIFCNMQMTHQIEENSLSDLEHNINICLKQICLQLNENTKTH